MKLKKQTKNLSHSIIWEGLMVRKSHFCLILYAFSSVFFTFKVCAKLETNEKIDDILILL